MESRFRLTLNTVATVLTYGAETLCHCRVTGLVWVWTF